MRKKLTSLFLSLAIVLTLCPTVLAAGGEDLSLSTKGLQFLASFDEFSAKAYSKDGKWFIGYHTPCEKGDYPDGITKDKALALLAEAAEPAEEIVNDLNQDKSLDLSQSQFDALVSFSLSMGDSWLNSQFATYLYQGLDQQNAVKVADSLAVWSHVGDEVDEACLNRRLQEAELLLYGNYEGGDHFAALILQENGGTLSGNDTVCFAKGSSYGTLPTASREGYTFDGWKTDDGALLTSSMTAKTTQRVTASWTATGSLGFTDVSPSDWYYTYVYDLYKAGIVNGYSATTFAPQLPITAGQALKLVVLAAGFDAQPAAKGHWAGGYLNFAIQKGFTTNSGMDLDAAISRLEIAQLAAKALSLPASTTQSPFADSSDPAVLSLYDAGVLEGSQENGKTLFKPNDRITRAEITTIIWRMEQLENTQSGNNGNTTIPSKPETPEENHNGQFQYNGKWLDILPGVPLNTYTPSKFYTYNGFTQYNSPDYTCKIGVDVSSYQGDIDWTKVKNAGVDFAIIRVGGRGYGSSGNLYDDASFTKNIEGALAAGLEVGVYFFSQAITEQEAIQEAEITLDKIKGYRVTYPVVFDWENVSSPTARTSGITAANLGKCAQAFCKTVENAGYTPMVYFNTYCGYFKYDLRDILDYDWWFAGYTTTPNFYYNFQMWQYTSKGSVDGIPGNVDVNLQFIPN